MVQTQPLSEPMIAVAGPASVDMTLRQPPAEWIGSTGRDVYTSATMHRLEAPVEMGLGGNGAAAAYVIGRLGLPVRLNAPIGNDTAGKLVLDWLVDTGVEIIAPNAIATMLSLAAVDAEGKRLGTLQYPGTPVDWLLSAVTDEATWLLAAIPSQMPNGDLARVQETLRTFRKPGRATALDTGRGWIHQLQAEQIIALWKDVDLLIGTIEELSAWSGCKKASSITQFALDHGPKQVVVKMGSDGAAYQSKTEDYEHQPACTVSRSDLSIGAGDAFNGALVASLARGQSLAQAVTQGQQVAAKVVESGRGVLGWDSTI